MQIDFNNVRRKQIDAVTKLIHTLNNSFRDGGDREKIIIYVDEVRDAIDEIRGTAVGIAASYLDGDPLCKCVLKDDEKIPEFLPEDYIDDDE
jgi:hypothetical protein